MQLSYRCSALIYQFHFLQVNAFLQPPMKGVVIQSYGAGNGPDARKDLLKIFRKATDRGMIIVNITQCNQGMVSTAYATGQVKNVVTLRLINHLRLRQMAAISQMTYF